jgi:DNA-binding transcriptional regulator YiaG
MPNIASVLKEEIQRLARKQVKAGLAPLKRDNVRLKKSVADLKRQVTDLARANSVLQRRGLPAGASEPVEAASNGAPKLRPTSKSLESLRHRLGLTQVEFAQLLGVSGQAVVYWAARRGRVHMRAKTLAALADVQKIGKREARRRLEAQGGAA